MRSGASGLALSLALLAAATTSSVAQEEPEPRFEIELRFEGDDEVAAADLEIALRGLVADLRRQGVEETDVEDARYLLERYYATRGFPHAEVKAHSRRTAGGFAIRFTISEGRRTRLGRLRIAGAEHLEAAKLRECFRWESPLLGLGAPVFTPFVLEEGLACIESLYRLEGYWFVSAEAEVYDRDLDAVRVVVSVDEGPRVMVREPPAIEGVEAFDVAEVREALEFRAPAVFVPRLPAVLRGRVLDFYRTRGYLKVEVEVRREIDRAAGRARLELRVREGPRVRVRALDLQPADRWTFDGVIERYVKLRPGDLWNEERVRESHRALLRSGLFDSVSLRPREVEGEPERVDLVVDVVEKVRYTFELLAGYGSWEQLRGAIAVENTNVLGTGHRLRVSGGGSFKGERVEVEQLDPYFFSERIAQDASGRFERREQRVFTSRELEAEGGLRFALTDRLRGRLFYRARDSRLLAFAADLPPELAQDVYLSSVNATASFDTRKRLLDPLEGYYARALVEYSGAPLGSELDFLRPELSLGWIVPLRSEERRLRLALGARLGAVAPLAGDEIPVQERYFAGGDDTIRSFREDQAGPRRGGTLIGGEARLLFNAELRFPLPLPLPSLLEGLEGVVFGDAGTVNERLASFGGGRYFFAVGGGLRYNTPIGPFRVDVAANPDRDREKDEVSFVVHFGLGYPF